MGLSGKWLPKKVPHLVNLSCKDTNMFIHISDIAYSRYQVYILPTWIILFFFFFFFSVLNFIMCAPRSVCESQRMTCRCVGSPLLPYGFQKLNSALRVPKAPLSFELSCQPSLFAMKSKLTSDLSSSSLCLHSARLQVVPTHVATQNFWAGTVSHQKNTCRLWLNRSR